MDHSETEKMKTLFSIEDCSEMPFEDAFGVLNEGEKRNAPDRLFLSGNPALLTAPRRVSIIGRDYASPKGLLRARNLGAAVARENGILVCSLAPGIKETALSGAIEEEGKVIAVLEQPLNLFYPRSLRRLGRMIGKEHLLVSPYQDQFAHPGSEFETGGATLSLISDAMVIVEASFDSPVLGHAWEAIRLGRPLFICEELIAETIFSDWPEELLDHGAEVLRTERGIDQIVANLPEVSRAECAALSFDD